MRLIFLLTMLFSVQVHAAAKLQDADFKTVTQLINGGGSAAQLLNDTKVYVTANGINQQLSSAITSGLIGGSAGQNLVSNGNFEASGVSGWATFQTTLSSGLPSSAPATCSSCTFAIGAQSSGALDGSNSLQLTGASTTTAGQGFISNAFAVAPAFQGQVMYIKGVFSVVSGLAALNLSGTAANSFAIYIYDVTNAQWIQPAGVYAMASNGGPFAASSFQIPSNSTSLRLAVVNINAMSAASTLLFDDLAVGPQANGYGLAGADYRATAAPVVNATGGTSPTRPTSGVTETYGYSRIGDNARVMWSYTATATTGAAAGSGDYLFTLPAGLSFDSTKVTFNTAVWNANAPLINGGLGSAQISDSASYGVGQVYPYDATRFRVVVNFNNTGPAYGRLSISSANFFFGQNANQKFSFDFLAPIAGWASNVSQSSDFDGRPTLFQGVLSSTSQSLTANTTPIALTTVKDAAGAWATNQYTVPVAGDYQINGSLLASNVTTIGAFVNGTYRVAIGVNNAASNQRIPLTGTLTNLAPGQVITLRADASVSVVAGSNFSSTAGDVISIVRVAGSSPVVQSGQNITATVGLQANQAISALGVIKYDYKFDDSANVYSPTTGFFTAPVSGKFRLQLVANSDTQRNYVIYKNVGGTITRDRSLMGPPASVTASAGQSIRLNAGEGVAIYIDGSANVAGGTAPALVNTVTFERTGN